LEDYVKLSNTIRQLNNIKIIWVFGPDDLGVKEKIIGLIPDSDLIYKPPTLLDYCFLIRDSELLISTSTGPMHLAGMLNIKTISFFGDSLFASPNRWATISEAKKQHNLIASQAILKEIQKTLLLVLDF
jgi:ADP-heptose:LPS heptosyltransferase